MAQTYRALNPERPILIAADNDHRREAEGKPNVGREKAELAAAAIGGQVLLPGFEAGSQGSDWNDLTRDQGQDAARLGLRGAVAAAECELMARGLAASREQAAPGQDRGGLPMPAQARERDRAPEMELELELEL